MAFDPIAEGATEITDTNNFDPIAEGATEISQPSVSSEGMQDASQNPNGFLSFLPKPSLPIGLNVASGLLSSFLPTQYKDMASASPQIATGTNFGIPQQIASNIGSVLPSIEAGGSSLLGQSASGGALGALSAPQGQGLEGGLTNALSTVALGKLAGQVFNPFITKTGLVNKLQKSYDDLSSQATAGFKNVSNQVYQRGISKVPIDDSLIDQASSYFPNTKNYRSLIDSAQNGDYNALRDLQSDLGTKSMKGKYATTNAERNAAAEMFELRNKINDAINLHFLTSGNPDLAQTLSKANNDYSTLQNLYVDKSVPKQIRDMVNPKVRKTPDDIADLFNSNDSVAMKNIKNANPFIDPYLNVFAWRKALPGWKSAVGGTVAGAGVYHYLKPSKNPFSLEEGSYTQ